MRVTLTLVFAFLASPALAQTVSVSTAGSREPAEFHGNGKCDQVEINKAIGALPEAGGTVHLAEGVYDICADSGTYGGIIIERSNVQLTGEGPGTLLRLAERQNVNVIRIKGDGVNNVIISDLRIDAGAGEDKACNGDLPYVPHSRFECSGIKAHYMTPDDYRAGEGINPAKHIQKVWVRRVQVENANGINIMLSGRYMFVHDSFVGDSRSDSVEILVGPGQISRTTLVVDEETGYGLSTDAANDVQMNDNLLHMLPGGEISQSLIRTWEGFRNNQVNDNLVAVEDGAIVRRLMEINTLDSIAADNLISR